MPTPIEKDCQVKSEQETPRPTMTTLEVSNILGLTVSTLRNWYVPAKADYYPIHPLPRARGTRGAKEAKRRWDTEQVLILSRCLADSDLYNATGLCLTCLLRLVDRGVLPEPRPKAWRDHYTHRWWPEDTLTILREQGWELRK